MKNKEFPPSRSDLKDHFGYLSFNCTLINLDIVGIRLVNSGEVVVITYRGNRKTGFIYEGDKLNEAQVMRTYSDVPETWNDLQSYEKAYEGRIEILNPLKDNYVFISEQEIIEK
ncbi:Uncharacterised protein [Chryseobacterium nakagawai]|uniref:Uncharacterized protein n=1 Tax=Chryseobacterium nakagawai TaxID=1241982 RepID=A0AAD1DSZ7_CHRNA|nr:hypothetical protein [Chryseobacterium nakagawai]AZA93020.1 hypothetical protein EG343_21660 [Chryseobacterium nakagawai]VEH19651.1 Uncharacterised protein [Chryseobacterium nakagawai]